MKQIKIFSPNRYKKIDDEVNEFIKDKNVIAIKICIPRTEGATKLYGFFDIIIIYEV